MASVGKAQVNGKTCFMLLLLHSPCRQTFDGGYKWSVRTFGNLDEEEEINYRFQKVRLPCRSIICRDSASATY